MVAGYQHDNTSKAKVKFQQRDSTTAKQLTYACFKAVFLEQKNVSNESGDNK